MRKFLSIAMLAIIAVLVTAPLIFAQVDSADVGGGEPPPTIDVVSMIIMAATSLAGFLVGLAIKQWPVLEGYSNRLIPYTILGITAIGFVWLRDLPFEQALLQAGAATLGSVLIAEATIRKPRLSSGPVRAVVLAACLAAPAIASADSEMLRPRWAGPVTAIFTTAGPDSVRGPRAKIHVPLVVALTDPVHVGGYTVTPSAQFKWTTKAYLREESSPGADPSYNWFPHLRIEPDSANAGGILQWIKVGPDHESNFEDAMESRSKDNLTTEVALAWEWSGIKIDAYLSVWYTYKYGSNTEGIADAINTRFLPDVGGKVILRGSVSMLQVATELGPEWQKYMGYIPFPDFYHFGVYAEYHNGKFEGLDNYGNDTADFGGGLTYTPPL